MSRPLFVTALLAAALGSATTAWLAASAPAAPPSELAADALARPTHARVPRRPHVDLRPSIEHEEERALPGLHGRADVEAYLDRLEARARAQGRVTAVEIEPGMTAIFALRGPLPEGEVLALAEAFDARMQALGAELGAAARPAPPRFEEALAALARAEGSDAREAATRVALDALEPLDEPTRLAAEARLDAALGAPEPPPAADPQALRQAIDQAAGARDRALAVRRYVEAVENLPREQAEGLLAEVEHAELPGTSLL
jgi:hypothetical protein